MIILISIKFVISFDELMLSQVMQEIISSIAEFKNHTAERAKRSLRFFIDGAL
jgi:hypothetical protein